MLKTDLEIEKQIFDLIRNTEDYYSIKLDNNEIIKKENLEHINKMTSFGLNNLQYRFNQMEKKKKDIMHLRHLNNNKKVINTICSNYSEIEEIDNHNLPWNKLDKWQKKQKIKKMVEIKYENNQLVHNYLLDLFKKGKINKLSKNIIYNDGFLDDIILPEFKEFCKSITI